MISGTWGTSGFLTCTSYTTRTFAVGCLINAAAGLLNRLRAASFVAAFMSPCYGNVKHTTIEELPVSTHQRNGLMATASELVHDGIQRIQSADVNDGLCNFNILEEIAESVQLPFARLLGLST